MGYPLLEQVNDPQQLKALPADQLEPLCEEIRQFLIENVSKTGGHLSSNLGTIELTVALHRAFSTPQDKFVFDVGHQCYTHKILTGRRERFDSLRQLGGISGFPNPKESVHDAFVAGHGNTAISVAIGMAQAKKIKGEPGKVIALVGDGAFTGGMVYEGMNNIDTLNNLIVILNDNKMSISKNVGFWRGISPSCAPTRSIPRPRPTWRPCSAPFPAWASPSCTHCRPARRCCAGASTTPPCLRRWAFSTWARWTGTTCSA